MREFHFAKNLLVSTAAMAMISCASAVGAATLAGSATSATGIDDLVIDNIAYDVTFINNSYNTVYAVNAPTFLNNSSGATDAATALITNLNSLGVGGLTGESPSYNGNYELVVPSSVPSGVTATIECSTFSGNTTCGSSWGTTDYTIDPSATYSEIDYAVFTPTVTPVPAAFPLFACGIGMVGLFGVWRRHKQHIVPLAS